MIQARTTSRQKVSLTPLLPPVRLMTLAKPGYAREVEAMTVGIVADNVRDCLVGEVAHGADRVAVLNGVPSTSSLETSCSSPKPNMPSSLGKNALPPYSSITCHHS